ncbi:MAG: hypothetical protein JWM02_3252 [Frankiales bacterium]|nr:hypothetical protein [Frankiales bacterium]
MTRVYLEVGKTWVFACAIDLPGWCRRGKGEEAALEALLDYADRYRDAVGPVGPVEVGELQVVGRLPGTMTTDFGAPDAIGPWDSEPVSAAERSHLADVLTRCWQTYDEVVAQSPAELRKGPRGGGRDRDKMVDHVREAERSYARKLDLRVPPRTPWAEQRKALVKSVEAGTTTGAWPLRYACRRIAWHVLDHAWETEDRSP